MVNWTHNGKEMLSHGDFTSDTVGFIYRIIYTDNREYIGKKLIRSNRKLKPTKKQLAIRKNYKRVERIDLKFTDYEGSSKNTVGLIISKKEIIELSSDKVNLSYMETKWLMRHDVLCDDKYLNDCIGGTYYSGKIHKGL